MKAAAVRSTALRVTPWEQIRLKLTEKVVEEVELLGIIDAEDTKDRTEAEMLLLEH